MSKGPVLFADIGKKAKGNQSISICERKSESLIWWWWFVDAICWPRITILIRDLASLLSAMLEWYVFFCYIYVHIILWSFWVSGHQALCRCCWGECFNNSNDLQMFKWSLFHFFINVKSNHVLKSHVAFLMQLVVLSYLMGGLMLIIYC
jgi:hypothetical protein